MQISRIARIALSKKVQGGNVRTFNYKFDPNARPAGCPDLKGWQVHFNTYNSYGKRNLAYACFGFYAVLYAAIKA